MTLTGCTFTTDNTAEKQAGGSVMNGYRDFPDGIWVKGTQIISDSREITASTVAISATTTATGNIVANGTHNQIGASATSTAQIGKANKAGCLILGDSAGGGSVVYIIASGATITASTTKPAACNTAK